MVMKSGKSILLATLLLGLVFSGAVWAHGGQGHGHHRGHSGLGVGIVIGAGWASMPYYGYPRYYYAPPVYYSPYPSTYAYPYPAQVVTVSPPAPPIYIEQAPQASAAQGSNYWYYCSNPQGYYPSVNACSMGWQKVAPQPSSPK
jgi:hypothetical protein